MKKLLGLVFLFCAATVFSANPSLFIPWTAIRGTNGITTTTNPSVGVVIFDPRAFTNDAGFSNRVIQLVNANAPSGPWTNSNGTVSNTVSSTVSNGVFATTVLQTSGNLFEWWNTDRLHARIAFNGSFVQTNAAGSNFFGGVVYASNGIVSPSLIWTNSGGTMVSNRISAFSSYQFGQFGDFTIYARSSGAANMSTVSPDSAKVATLNSDNGGSYLQMSISGQTLLNYQPMAPLSAVVPYIHGTTNIYTSGSLSTWWNGIPGSGALAAAIDFNGAYVQTNANASNYFGGILRSGKSAHIATNTAPFTTTTNDFVLNAYNTNLSQRAFVRATVTLTNAAFGDVAAIALYVDQDGNDTWEDTGNEGRLQSSSNALIRVTLSTMLDPGARYIFTNLSTGGGVGTINANSSRWFRQ